MTEPKKNEANENLKSIPDFEIKSASMISDIKEIQQTLDGILELVKSKREALAQKEELLQLQKQKQENLKKNVETTSEVESPKEEIEKVEETVITVESVVETTIEPAVEPEAVKEIIVEQETVIEKVEEQVSPEKEEKTQPSNSNIQMRDSFTKREQSDRSPYNPAQRDGTRPPYNPAQRDGTRPPYNPAQRDGSRPPYINKTNAAVVAPPDFSKQSNIKKKEPVKKAATGVEDKVALSKKARAKRGYEEIGMRPVYEVDGTEIVKIKLRHGSKKAMDMPQRIVIDKAILTTETVQIKTLSEKIGKTCAEIIQKLFELGTPKTINDKITFDEAELISSVLGVTLELQLEKTSEDMLNELHIEDNENDECSVTRPPIVTIMGHVDHGKTSLLDYIRKANVASSEAGGITQHIGAYMINLNGNAITFIDTPGHEAFTAMRARGANLTDIAVIVIAAEDGIMPQTTEAINHAKAAGVSIIVAVNKMDKPGASADRVMQQLVEHELLPEAWGGETPVIPISALTGMNVDKLLENILLTAELKELKANPKRYAKGVIVESKLDKGKGPMATVLVQNGTLHIHDFVVAGTTIGKIRAMLDDKGRAITSAGPSTPVSILGLQDVPNAGDPIFALQDEKLMKQVVEGRKDKEKVEMAAPVRASLESLFGDEDGQTKKLNIILKADVQGSIEALKLSLEKLSNEEVDVKVIHSGVGAINESDVMLAGTSNAIIIGFNVRPDSKAKTVAENKEVKLYFYRVIYDAIDDVEKAIKGMLDRKYKEVVLGSAEVRQTFRITGVGTIAGCMVKSGKITRNAKLRLLRDNTVIHEGNVSSLKRLKDDAKEVAAGYECGIGIADYNDIKEGDVIDAFIMEEIK